MMIRKPTKIELKPEDDFHEYEDYKKKQLEATKNLRPDQRGQFPKGSHEKIIPESVNAYYKIGGGAEPQPKPSTQINPQLTSNSSPVFDTFLNLQRSLQSNEILDFPPNINARNDPSHINQLFSMLLNNLSARGAGTGSGIMGGSQPSGSSSAMNLEGGSGGSQPNPRGGPNNFM